MKKIYAQIDGKDVCDDWIFDDVFKQDWMYTPYDKRGTHDVIGFYDGYLLSAHWTRGGSTIEFNFIDFPCAIVGEGIIKELIDYLNGANDNENSDLKCEVTNNNTQIIVTFYREEE